MRKRELMGLFKFLESQGYETNSLSKFIFNLKNENEELKKQLNELQKPQIFIDTQDMEERYGEELYQDYLEKQVKELKKQLEHCYCNRTDCSGRIKDSKQYDSLVQKVEAQQQEFIKYLEDEKDRLARECSHIYEDSLGKTRLVSKDIFDEVDKNLQKYKEIIGVSDD